MHIYTSVTDIFVIPDEMDPCKKDKWQILLTCWEWQRTRKKFTSNRKWKFWKWEKAFIAAGAFYYDQENVWKFLHCLLRKTVNDVPLPPPRFASICITYMMMSQDKSCR